MPEYYCLFRSSGTPNPVDMGAQRNWTISKPSSIYSNVDGGLGIFAGLRISPWFSPSQNRARNLNFRLRFWEVSTACMLSLGTTVAIQITENGSRVRLRWQITPVQACSPTLVIFIFTGRFPMIRPQNGRTQAARNRTECKAQRVLWGRRKAAQQPENKKGNSKTRKSIT